MPNGSAAEGYGGASVPVGSTVVLVISKGVSPAVSTGALAPDTAIEIVGEDWILV